MSEETKNTAQEEETTDTPVTEETVENEPEVVENGEAETEEIPVEDGDEEASQDDKKDSKSKTSFFGKKKKEKDKFEQQIEELTDRLKRNMAEFDNFRKRTEKEKSSMYIIGAKDIVEKMLPVVDNFERGLAQAPEGDSFADGMKMIYKQLNCRERFPRDHKQQTCSAAPSFMNSAWKNAWPRGIPGCSGEP